MFSGVSHLNSFIAHGAPTQMQQHVSYAVARSSPAHAEAGPSVCCCRTRIRTPAAGGNTAAGQPHGVQQQSERGCVGVALHSRLSAAAYTHG